MTRSSGDLDSLSEGTRKALIALARQSRQGASDAELRALADRLREVERHIKAVAANLPSEMKERSAGLDQTAEQTERLRDLVEAEVSLTVRDYEGQLSDHAERLEYKFGNLITAEEIRALASQSDSTAAYIATRTADSAILAHIDGFGRFLNDWSHIAVFPAAEMLDRATAGTTQVSVTTQFPIVVGEVLDDARARRSQEASRQIDSKLAQAERATTNAGKVGLTAAFVEVRDEAVMGARLWTAAVFVCVVLGIVIPVVALGVDVEALAQLTGMAGVLIKAFSGVPLFALAGYSGHIAAQHRETARHLTVLTAQLNSVQAYSNELPSDEKLVLMSRLGQRAFADPGFTLKEQGLSLVPQGATEAISQIKGIVEKLPGKGS